MNHYRKLEAGFLIYDNGEYAYTVQQLQFMKLYNDFAEDVCFHDPVLYDDAREYFQKKGVSLKSNTLPGNADFLPIEYKKYIATYSDLRAHCFGRASL